ncbi:MAG: hypothetical protein RR855_22405, partial [Comamonas sp.]
PFAGRCSFTAQPCFVERPPAHTLQTPGTAAPVSLACWRQPHVVHCLRKEAIEPTTGTIA